MKEEKRRNREDGGSGIYENEGKNKEYWKRRNINLKRRRKEKGDLKGGLGIFEEDGRYR